MYCVLDTQFYCDGIPEAAGPRLAAAMEDIAGFLATHHPGVICTHAVDSADPVTVADLRVMPDVPDEARYLGLVPGSE